MIQRLQENYLSVYKIYREICELQRKDPFDQINSFDKIILFYTRKDPLKLSRNSTLNNIIVCEHAC
jgi:hypothetical protein